MHRFTSRSTRLLELLGACAGSLCGASAFAGAVTLSLSSPQDGATLSAGDTVEWSIEAQASSDDSAGLALILVDLAQSDSNPERFDIPPASEVPAGMEPFSRPLGLSNPGEGGLETGYVGVQRGEPGAHNLVQIGGAQNTTGQTGVTMAQAAQAFAGFGQSGAFLIARGTFVAPPTPGAYAFDLANARANTLAEVRDAPAPSIVRPASVSIERASFSFTVGGEPPRCALGCFLRGDCNGDGEAAGSVTDAVFLLQFNFLGGTEPPCLAACDVNGDGSATGSVTDAVYLLQFNFLGGPRPPPPFPACGESDLPSDAALGCLGMPEGCP